jgi:putative ABC transport system permease protein
MPDWQAYVRKRLPLDGIRPELQQDVVDDLAAQLAEAYREHLARGLPEADAAEAAGAQIDDWEGLARTLAASRRLAAPVIDRLETRAGDTAANGGRGAGFIAGLLQDVRVALRMGRGSRGLAATIVLTLALGIGANTAIFSVVNALLLRPLPIAEPDRLVVVAPWWSFAMWQALQPHASIFDGGLAWTPVQFNLAEGGEQEPVDGIFASGHYFRTLGVPAVLGRTFTGGDDRPGGGADGPVAVISHRLWQQRFGGTDGVVGARLTIDGVPVTIVGVTPPSFTGLDVGRAVDVTLPLEAEPLVRGSRSSLQRTRLVVMLRLRPGQSVEAATSTLRGLQPRLMGISPDEPSPGRSTRPVVPFTLVPAATGTSLPVRGPNGLRQTYERPLFTILAVALLVLLIACVNVANLLLARGAARRHELGVRLALGASRGRLARQLLVESLALAALGAAGGLIVARWSGQALAAQLATAADRLRLDVSLDWRILAFTAAVAAATAAIFGLLPALRATRIAPMDALQARPRAGTSGIRRSAGLTGGLVILQMSFSLAVVIAAVLFVRTFAAVSSVPLGFDPDRVLVVNVDTERARIDPDDRARLFQRIVDAAASAPGVAYAGGSIWTPVDGGMRMGDTESRVAFNFVTPGWFAAYGTALRAGRDFTVRDTAGAQPVVIVNEAFVRAHLPGQSALGETVSHPRSRSSPVERTIVGVVDDAVFESQREGVQAMVYLPVAQAGTGATQIGIGVRPAAGTPRQVARGVGAAIERVDPGLSYRFDLLTDHVQASVRQERLVAVVSGTFGALALAIAALGLYGVTSYTVNQRVTEIGIRRALGAQRVHVLALVLGRSLALTFVGIALGLAGAAAGTRYLGALLFGLTPLDPATFTGVAALFAVVATLAAAIPAYRAATVDPLVALRHQ